MKVSVATGLGRYLKISLGLLAVTAALSACADHLPVPGGTSEVNKACFSSVADMQARILAMQPGMTEAAVFAYLCAKRESLSRLERRDIRTALLGGPNLTFTPASIPADPDSDPNDPNYVAPSDSEIIQSLYGYKFSYKSVRRKHGFTSPIRIRTDETGFDYTVTLIFRNGKLLTSPILTGGPVKNISSGTIFDAITPGTLISRIPGP